MKLVKWLKLNAKDLVLSGLILLFLVSLAAAGLVWYLGTRPIAVVNGEKITWDMAKATQSQFTKFYTRSGDKTGLKNLDESAQILVEEKIVEAESAKRGITVSDQEIADQYNKNISESASETDYLNLVKAEYGWDKAQVEHRITIDLLRTKLEAVVLNNVTVDGYYFRYDIYGANTDAVNTAKATLESVQKDILAGKSLKDATALYVSDPKWQAPASSSLHFSDLNSTTEKTTFEGRQDWQDISKLSKVDDVTSVIKSDGGYFAIYQLVSKTNGGYDTWDSYLSSFYSNNSVNLAFNNVKNTIALGIDGAAARLGLPQKAFAASVTCDNSSLGLTSSGTCCYVKDITAANHYGKVSGTVYDSVTRSKLVGTGVTLSETHNYSSLCGSAITALGGNTFDTSGSGNHPSDSSGYYLLKGINCWLHYSVTATKTGYDQAFIDDLKPLNGGTISQNIYMYPSYTLTVNIDPPNAATPTNSSNTPASSGHYAIMNAGFTSVQPTWNFLDWTSTLNGAASNNCNGSSPAQIVTMTGGNVVCTAHFSQTISTISAAKVVIKPDGISDETAGVIAPLNTTASSQSYSATVFGTHAGYTGPVWSSGTVGYACPSGSFAKGAAVNLTCTATFTLIPVTSSCKITATPITGLSPLVVKVSIDATSDLTTFKYDMNDGTATFVNKPSTFYYTYSSPGTYHIGVTGVAANGATTACVAKTQVNGSTPASDTVTVSSGGGTGNEVAP